MSKVNFKAFADNIFSLLSPPIIEYTTLIFDKESVIKQIKSGTVEYSNIELRKERSINFLTDFFITEMILKELKITIPADKENFAFEGTGLIATVELKSFNGTITTKFIKDMLREMSENFIKEAVASMDKNSKEPTFWDNIAETLYKNLILNMRLSLKDVCLNLIRGDDCFIMSFDEIDFSNETGITKIQGARIFLVKNKDKLTEWSFIDKCSFETQYNRETHVMKLHTHTMKFNINPAVYQALMDLRQERDDNKNKIKCFKRRMNAKYYRPKYLEKNQDGNRINNKKEYYLSMWRYAITTVNKLRKYIQLRWYTAFELSLSQYEELAKDYYKNKNEDIMLLMQKHLFLKYSRNKVEETILQNKKKPGTNALFNLFLSKASFSSSSTSAPTSFSNEEKAILDRVYSKESIKKFIKGNWSDPIFLFDKFVLFMTKIGFDIYIENLNVSLNNNHSTLSFNLNQFSYDFIIDDKADWWESYNLHFNEIGNYKNILYQDKSETYVLKVKSYQKTEIDFGFKHLILNKELIDFFNLFGSYTNSHCWRHALIKLYIKKEFMLNEFVLRSIPNVSIKHKNILMMIVIYQFGCVVSPSEAIFEFEVKEKNAKSVIIARNKVLLRYKRELRSDRYELCLDDVICHLSIPIMQCLSELINIKDKNKQCNGVEIKGGNNVIDINEIIINTNSNNIHEEMEKETFDFGYDNSSFKFETQIGKFQLSLLNDSKPSVAICNLKLMQKNNETMIYLDKSCICCHKQTIKLFLIIYSQFITNDNPSHNNQTQSSVNSNNSSILFQIQTNILELHADNSVIQLVTNNMMLLNKNSKLSFNLKSNQLIYLSSIKEKIFIAKMNNDFLVEYTALTNKLSCKTSNPSIQIDLSLIDKLLSFISAFQLLLKQDDILKPSLPSSSQQPKLINSNKNNSPFNYEFIVSTPYIMFDTFKLELSKIEVANELLDTDSFNITCSNFLMSIERIELIKENKLSLHIFYNKDNEINCEILLNYLQIYFLQQDITRLVNSFDYEGSVKKYQRITRLMGSNEWKDIEMRNSNINDQCNGIIEDNIDNNNNQTKTNKKNFIIRIPKCEVDFSLNTKEKLIQVQSEGMIFELTDSQDKNIEIQYKITTISSFFNQYNNTKFNLISLNTNPSFDEENEKKNVLTPTIDPSTFIPQYQLVITYKDNLLDISLTSIKMFLRIDAFYTIYSYFYNAIPSISFFSHVKDANINMNTDINFNTNTKIRCLFIDSSFVLQTSFDNKENLVIQFDQFYSLYQTQENQIPYGQLFIQINSIRGEFVEGSTQRRLFFSKNDFLICKCHISQNSLNVSMVFDTITINLSYKDIISFLKAYHIGVYYMDKEKRIQIKESIEKLVSGDTTIVDNNALVYSIEFEIGQLTLTLIDNLQNSYYPFLNFNITKLNIEFINDQVDISLLPSIYSYNYISSDWEPTLEPVLLQFQYKTTNFSLAKKKIVTCYVHQDISINLSDMNISLTWSSLSRWIERFLEEKRSYEKSIKTSQSIDVCNQIMITDDISYLSKISNNSIRNISGNECKVIYQGKQYFLHSGNSIDLEYINEVELNSNNNKKEIELIYLDHQIKFPIKKMGVRMHRIDDNSFFISEISLTKQLSFQISIYSPVIFHNKSQYGITIVFENNHNQDTYFMILPSKSKQGVPFNHLNSSFGIYFSNVLPDSNNSLSVKEILDTPVDGKYQRNLAIETKFLLLKLVRVLQNVRKLVINAEHVIINYLPCNLIVKCGDIQLSMKKSTVSELDFQWNRKLSFAIQVGNYIFYSQQVNFFAVQDKVFYMSFKHKEEVFYVTAMLYEKETQKVLVLYSEYLIKNNSNLNLKIASKDKDNQPFCFKVSSDIYLISANPDMKNSWFTLSPYDFQSKKIFLKELLSDASDYNVKMSTKENMNLLTLNIQTNVSYLPKMSISFTEMLCTVIFEIQPICKITNLLDNKWIYIASEVNKMEYFKLPPLTMMPFHFFNLGKERKICFSVGLTEKAVPVEWTDPLWINQFDFYTCCVSDNIFNVEIRQNNDENITDIFITKSTASNSKILINNQTKHQIVVYQNNDNNRMQIIETQKREQFNIYSINNTELLFIIDNKTFTFRLLEIREPRTVHLDSEIFLYTESNGLKTYFTFYNVNQYNCLLPEAKQFNFDLNFTSIYISLIGDNKYKEKKLGNYNRNEILLMELKNIQVQILQKTNKSLLNKLNSLINASLETIRIDNQISTFGKFATVLSSHNQRTAFTLSTDCDIYPYDKICKVNEMKMIMSSFFIGVDPNFVENIIHFIKNVVYRMNIINFNVDDVFIDNSSNRYNISSEVNETLLMESYQANSILYSINNFSLPEINFSFELSKIGLKSLLQRQFKFNSFISSILSNLAGETHSIKLSKGTMYHYLGTLNNLISMILSRYRRLLFSECNKIGFKGVLLGFTNLFKQKEHESFSVKIDRRRLPRPFYGQYKSIKKYDETHAYIYEIMINIFGGFTCSYHFTDGVRTSSGIISFTISCLFIFNLKKQIEKMIDYFYIKNVSVSNNKVIIQFNQSIDNRLSQTLAFNNNDIAEVIAKKLILAIESSTDPIQMLN